MDVPSDPSVTLRSGRAEAVVWPARGGLVSSLALVSPKGESRELLWMPGEGAPESVGWPGGGIPLLFPFGGRVWDQSRVSRYRLGESVYEMGLHGFAYDKPWSLVHAGDREVRLTLDDDPESRRVFPFRFRLSYEIQLHESELRLDLGVEHKPAGEADERPLSMPVSCGFHPYFRMPLGGQGAWDSCHLETSARRHIAVTPKGAAGEVTAPMAERKAPLSDATFHNLILGDHSEPRLSLTDERLAEAISISWDPATIPYSVLWANEKEGFFCAEPWMGLPDAVHNGFGCRWLGPGESFSLSVSIGLSPAQQQ